MTITTRIVLAAAVLASLGLSACEAAPTALVGLAGSVSNPSFVLYICQSEPRVSITVYEGSDPRFVLHGHVPAKRAMRIDVLPVGAGWTVDQGEFRPLPSHIYSANLSDAEERWLGGIASYATSDLQEIGQRILIDHAGTRKIVDQKGFVKEAEKTC